MIAERSLPTGREGRHGFRFELPPGPYSYSGRMFTIRWALELLVDPAGVRRLPITVSPTLSELAAPPDEAE